MQHILWGENCYKAHQEAPPQVRLCVDVKCVFKRKKKMLKLSNIGRFLPCVTPNLKDCFLTCAIYVLQF